MNKLKTLETDRESKYVEFVKNEGYVAVKMHKCGYPDRIILLDDGYCFMIEFKRDVSKFTKRKGEKLQQHIHEELRARGIHVYLCDTVKQAKAIFHYELRMSVVDEGSFYPYPDETIMKYKP